MVLGGGTDGTAFAELAALTATWDWKLGAPLKTPAFAHKEYLPAIFTGVLKNTASWLCQILSAASWMQVALLSGFGPNAVVWSLHSAVARACSCIAHAAQATTNQNKRAQRGSECQIPHELDRQTRSMFNTNRRLSKVQDRSMQHLGAMIITLPEPLAVVLSHRRVAKNRSVS